MLYAINPPKAVCGDICSPLISLWKEIKERPNELAESYRIRWERLQNDYMEYYRVRDEFNKSHKPEDLLFLSRTCVNGLIRFNSNGEFNNSLHVTRPGISPNSLKKIIIDWSINIHGAEFIADDYQNTTLSAQKGDLVYLDPPYFHTKGRYYGTINYDAFLTFLESLNQREVKYILSLDGIRGDDNFTIDLPKEMYKRHEYIPSGTSSFKNVMNKEKMQVLESLYLNW